MPVCTVCRTKYGKFKEYHTSADDLNYVSPEGLGGALELLKLFVQAMEYNGYYRIKCLCEPQLGKRGLYPTISQKGSYNAVKAMTDFIAYADGNNDLMDISNIISVPIDKLIPVIDNLTKCDLLEKIEKNS